MNTRKEQILMDCPQVERTFLPDVYDDCLLGWGIRKIPIKQHTTSYFPGDDTHLGDTTYQYKPVYAYYALKMKLRKRQESMTELSQLLYSNSARPVIVKKYSRKLFWDLVKLQNIPYLENMHSAAIGLTEDETTQHCLVYNIYTMQQAMAADYLLESDFQTKAVYDRQLQEIKDKIIPLCMGPFTPWYLTPVL